MPTGIPNRQYTGEFKQTVVLEVLKKEKSNYEIAREYGINEKRVRDWERIYFEYGMEGLYIEHRGKAKPPKLDKKTEEDLIAEVQRLRIENDYLKKLNALVQAEQQLPNKKHK